MKKLILCCLPVFALGSCVIVELKDDFDSISSTSSGSSGFVPHIYIRQNRSKTPLPPFRVDLDKMPKNLVMRQYDGTIRDSDIGFRAFALEYLFIKFADGTQIDCIDPSLPLSQRTFPIKKQSQQVFEGVISKRQDFTIHIKGFSTRDNGKRVYFHTTRTYRYGGKKPGMKTIFDEWAEV